MEELVIKGDYEWYPSYGLMSRALWLLDRGHQKGAVAKNRGMPGGPESFVKTIALAHSIIPLGLESNCLFSVYRKCDRPDGYELGPISHGLARQSGLLGAKVLILTTAFGGESLVTSGRHIRRAELGEKTSFDRELRSEVGDEYDDWWESGLLGQALEPAFVDLSVKLEEPGASAAVGAPGVVLGGLSEMGCWLQPATGAMLTQPRDCPGSRSQRRRVSKRLAVALARNLGSSLKSPSPSHHIPYTAITSTSQNNPPPTPE